MPKFRFSPNPNRASDIKWREWSVEAFEQAKEQKKPVLLAISAVWCHWCHIMDETSYSDERIIRLINDAYIPIRVEADQRPDIQSRYLLGGWPTTAILTDMGELITGGTYIPPGQLRRLLERTAEYYSNHYDQLQKESAARREQITALQSRQTIVHYEVNRRIVNDIIGNLHRSFDSKYGGFGNAPKFPNPPAIELLLRRAFLENNSTLLEMAIITLDHMAEGGLFDKVWGGFFRYSTERDWSSPHYEKLLANNAELIISYLHGYQVSDFIRYRDIAEKTLEFVDSFFADKQNGGFFGSQDADEQFYKLTTAEERLKSKIPYIDPIIYVDANALMVSAYIEAYKILGKADYLDFAKKTIEFLIKKCYSKDKGMAHYFDVEPHYLGWLSDQANMLGCLIDTYNVTGDWYYLDIAKNIAAICEKWFLASDGTFYDRGQSGEPDLGALFIKNKPLYENSMMARQLYRLAYVNGENRYEKMAEQILANIEIGPLSPSPELSYYGLAVDEILTQPVILTIVGTKDEAGTRALLKEAWRQYVPGKEIKLLEPIRDYEILEKSGFPPDRHPTMYPCIGRMCLPPVDTPHEFKAILEDLPGRPK
ncbi:MAG: DUF255 domain-containing protein [Firmicutes bacterium]|nr:DUF255 domain-containing protein [Bacillota bacterium]